MADILETKLDALAALTAEARAWLDDEREAMRRECEARVALAVEERDTERRLRLALERAAVEPPHSNARVKVFNVREVQDALYLMGLGKKIPTVQQAVALQALLGDHLPEGAIVIEGSSPLDPEERVEGPWVVAMGQRGYGFLTRNGNWGESLASAMILEPKDHAQRVAQDFMGVVMTLAHAEALKAP